MRRILALLVATWFGSGLVRPVILMRAGTYGSIAALPLCYLALQMGVTGHLLLTLCVFWIGDWSVPIAEIALGPRKGWRGNMKVNDQNEIVVDEVVGMLITCAPLLWIRYDLALALPAALVFFRFFDIVKPWPVSYFDRMKNSAGVMLDDVVAGVYAALALTALYALIGW